MDSLLLPVGLLLLAVALLQVRIVGHVAYPPSLLCAVWGAEILWLYSAGNRYSPVSSATLLIYLGGTAAFCLGGALGWVSAGWGREGLRGEPVVREWLVPLLTVLVVVLTPVYVAKVIAVVGSVPRAEFLYTLRVRTLDTTLEDGIGVAGNIVGFATMCALLATAVRAPRPIDRFCRALLIVLALFLAILTGGRNAPLSLIFGLGAIAAVNARSLPVRKVVMGLVAAMMVFALMGVLIKKGNARPDASLMENAAAMGDGLQVYSLAGIVGFERIVDDPASIPSNGGYLRGVQDIANHLGAHYEVPSQHLQWTSVGDAIDTNVYTMYSAYYPEVGFVGTLCLTLVVGCVSAIAHRRATSGKLGATLFFGMLAAATLQSSFGEPFYTNANFLGKLGIFVLFVSLVNRPTLTSTGFATTGVRRAQ
jgi:oligosaccharide repeat unit polymerase